MDNLLHMELVSYNPSLDKKNFSSQQNFVASVWEKCLSNLRGKISSKDFSSWIEQITPISCLNNIVILQVQSQFFSDWVEERFGELLRSSLSQILDTNVSVEYSIKKDEPDALLPENSLDLEKSFSTTRQTA